MTFSFFIKYLILHLMKEITYGFYEGPFGQMVVGLSDIGICWVGFMTTKEQGAYKGDAFTRMKEHFPQASFNQNDDAIEHIAPIILKAWEQDHLYDLELDLQGTDFQVSVWNALLNIPKGDVKSYGDIANEIGKPKASRAVGTAIGNNPISLIVPCHRVIQKSGTMGNYGWGLPLKERILKSEKAVFTFKKNLDFLGNIKDQVNRA